MTKHTRSLLVLTILSLATSAPASATTLLGSFALQSSGIVTVQPTQSDLSTATTVIVSDTLVVGNGTDDYIGITSDPQTSSENSCWSSLSRRRASEAPA